MRDRAPVARYKEELVQKAEFDEAFDDVISGALSRQGFMQRGKSFFLRDGDRQFAWVRGAGRFVVPGSIAHLVCFRHSFLRDKNEAVPQGAPGDVGSYPWVLSAELLPRTGATDWRFDASRLMNLPYGRYDFASASQSMVRADLSERLAGFLRYVDWAKALSVDEAMAQMRLFAEKYWIATLWMDDYEAVKLPRIAT